MNRLVLFAFSTAFMAAVTNSALAVQIAALDFTNNGEAWSIIDAGGPSGGLLPILFEKDGDPTKVGFEHPNTTDWGQYLLQQRIDAPEGMVMSNIRLEALVSGFSSWVMDGRVGFGLDEEDKHPLALDYGTSAAYWPGNNGKVVVDFPVFLDASGDPDYMGVPSIYVSVEIDKILFQVSQHADVSQIKIFADLSEAPTGDYNNDGTVDAADYVVWRKTGISGTHGYTVWQTNFGTTISGSGGSTTGAVPEPSSLVLLFAMAAASYMWPARCKTR